MDSNIDGKIIRAPSLRRGKTDERLCERIKLKKVLGLTVCSNAALDVSPTNGLLAYPAGCTVVLFNAKKLQQTHLLNTSKKTITAIAYSHCGRYIATGECGINPAIKVWELDNQSDIINDNSSGGTVISEFLGHKYAVTCVAFSPTGKYLVSVGSQHDMIVNVFDWKLNLKIASNKVSAKVSAVSFSEDGNYFVTVGNRHVKFWYLEGNRKYKEPIPLMGRSAILGELRNNDFCAVACGKGETSESTYAITRVGHLVEFNSRRLLDKWVACRTTSANCICVNTKYILVGCSEAIVRIFNSLTLEYITTLPRTHYLGVDVAQGVHINHIMNVPQNAKYPDTVAMVYDETRSKVTCVYNDHSLYVWDLRDIKRVGKSHSFLYHSACIWGVETVPSSNLMDTNTMTNKLNLTLPDDSFLTCSSDDTIRVWGLEGCQNNDLYRKNIYSKELLKIVYIDDDLNFIKDVDNPILSTEKTSTYDGRNGVRCIKISPDKTHLASGDRSGNIRVYNLCNLKLITMIEAHDSEVLCLEYTNEKIQRKLLASASRDRLIHVFDVNKSYKILQTLDDHSSSITSIKFLGSGLNFQMISCGADKSIVFRTFQNNLFSRGTNCSGKTTLYDMEIDSNSKHILTACQDRNIRVYGTQNGKHTKTFKGSHSDEGSLIKLSLDPSGIYIATSCTDKTLSVYDYYSNECMARMYGHSELVTGLKFTNDCRHLISASGDGCIFIWQVPHDMVVTMQARLSQQRIRSGQMPISRPLSSTGFDTTFVQQSKIENERIETFMNEVTLSPGYKFAEVGQLPQWAKRKNSESENTYTTTVQQQQQHQQQQQQSNTTANVGSISNLPSQNQTSAITLPVPKARGRWAQRGQFDSDTLDTKHSSELTPSTPVTNPTPTFNFAINNSNTIQTSDYNSASSKEICYHQAYLSEDSSLDSGVENRKETEKRLNEQKRKSQILRFETNNDNDGDVEDISDGERTSSDHGMMFYPTAVPGTPTDFKVNAMNEEELRKSVRKKHFEKVGLNLNAHSVASTGTGTSDTEDEGSTPSGENAERSLASTLGGSTENLPQQATSSFLQSALDGPGNLVDRGTKSRRSISAKHNNQNSQNNSLTYSKSYTNSKKEELMKVINEAKQKLEDVGYRSSLRGSLSVSDLSHVNPLDSSSRINRILKPGDFCYNNANTKYNTPSCSYFNCLATKSVLSQNCQIMRQIQKTYPPYPNDIGIYNNNQNYDTQLTNEYLQNSKMMIKNSKIRPRTLDLLSTSSSNDQDYEYQNAQIKIQNYKQQQQQKNITKNHKSCPVSPVHEELDWYNLINDRTINSTKYSNIEEGDDDYDDYDDNDDDDDDDGNRQQQQRQKQRLKKSSSMYSNDAKLILDMIHSDTEKMIAEITQKYGDLDTYDCKTSHDTDNFNMKISKKVNNYKEKMTNKQKFTKLNTDEKDNFSSDSLEDCSLSIDDRYNNKNKKSICKKHRMQNTQIIKEKNKTVPTRSVSDYFIYPEFYSKCPSRNVSLSDILLDCENEEQLNNSFMKNNRHSSASFFLVQYSERKSQDSILSDDLSNTTSLYNSMDSILSDESDCKSAPLEVLFNKAKRDTRQFYTDYYYTEKCGELTSKSYGSSPNNLSNFDSYMQNRNNYSYQEDIKFYPNERFYYDNNSNSNDNSNYNHLMRPKSPKSLQSFKIGIPTSNTFPIGNNFSTIEFNNDDNIPTLMHKNEEYTSGINRSLRKEFTDQRQLNNSNPLFYDVDDKKCMMGGIKTNYIKSDNNQLKSQIVKKSCSFDIEMNDNNGRIKISQYMPTRFEKNLRKFEKDQKHNHHHSSSKASKNTLDMDYVPHKPPVASRRSSSMRLRSRNRSKGRYNTVDQINISHPERSSSNEIRDFVNPNVTTGTATIGSGSSSSNVTAATTLKRNKSEEKMFEIFITEKGSSENMDSLELYTKPDLFKENSIDSLDKDNDVSNDDDYYDNIKIYSNKNSCLLKNNSKYHDIQFEDIEKKINVINKLIKIEEMKIEKNKLQTNNDNRDVNNKQPLFDCCNIKQKGYVKNLTMNFDKLVKNIQKEIEYEKNRQLFTINKVKRNFSLPDVLEGAKLQNYNFNEEQKQQQKQQQQQQQQQQRQQHNDELFKNDDVIKHRKIIKEGNPKSFLSVHNVDDSSIRRACSLSDLCVGKGHNNNINNNNPVNNVTPQKFISSSSNRQNVFQSRSSNKRNSLFSHKSNSNMGSRSISVGVLNQESDSETDTLESRDIGSHVYVSSPNRISFPSANNARQHSKGNAGNSSRRKTLSVSSSSVNLSTTGQDDSSSEEATAPSNIHPIKPIVPPRPRSLTADHKKITQSNGNSIIMTASPSSSLSGTSKMQKMTNSDSFHNDRNNTTLRNIETADNVDSTSQLCANIINMLNTTTNAVLQLHSRLKYNEEESGTKNNYLLLKELENAVIMTQNMLTRITNNKNDSSSHSQLLAQNKSSSDNTTELENSDYVYMMNKCADILNRVRNKSENMNTGQEN